MRAPAAAAALSPTAGVLPCGFTLCTSPRKPGCFTPVPAVVPPVAPVAAPLPPAAEVSCEPDADPIRAAGAAPVAAPSGFRLPGTLFMTLYTLKPARSWRGRHA